MKGGGGGGREAGVVICLLNSHFFFTDVCQMPLWQKMNLRGNKGKAAFSRTILYSVMKGRYRVLFNLSLNLYKGK